MTARVATQSLAFSLLNIFRFFKEKKTHNLILLLQIIIILTLINFLL